jgi:hypothetical protein
MHVEAEQVFSEGPDERAWRLPQPFEIRAIITRSRPQEQEFFGCGQLDNGLPGFFTLNINLSKCSHLVERWPRIQGSLFQVSRNLRKYAQVG